LTLRQKWKTKPTYGLVVIFGFLFFAGLFLFPFVIMLKEEVTIDAFIGLVICGGLGFFCLKVSVGTFLHRMAFAMHKRSLHPGEVPISPRSVAEPGEPIAVAAVRLDSHERDGQTQ